MRYRNNGQGESNILQNQFTAFLMNALRWQRSSYLKKHLKLGEREILTDFSSHFAQSLDAMKKNTVLLEQPILESLVLLQALDRLSDRDRRIFLARALEEYDFDKLANDFDMGYKGVAAAYYRAVQKLRQSLDE